MSLYLYMLHNCGLYSRCLECHFMGLLVLSYREYLDFCHMTNLVELVHPAHSNNPSIGCGSGIAFKAFAMQFGSCVQSQAAHWAHGSGALRG